MRASKKIKHTIVIPAIAPPDNCSLDEAADAVMVEDEEAIATVLEPEPSEYCEGDIEPVASTPGADVPRAAAIPVGDGPALTDALFPPAIPKKFPPPLGLKELNVTPLASFALDELGLLPGADVGDVWVGATGTGAAVPPPLAGEVADDGVLPPLSPLLPLLPLLPLSPLLPPLPAAGVAAG